MLEICTPHPEHPALAANIEEERSNYRSLFSKDVAGKLLVEIRSNASKGPAIGIHRFREEVESLIGRKVTALKKGDPIFHLLSKVTVNLVYTPLLVR
ncbi:transposase [Desulfosediminicola sp.]|uniref:transposase n=1 Tax=Desulfosediminicola sp. TaxID=2886825 RepID=UPI003AF2BE9F